MRPQIAVGPPVSGNDEFAPRLRLLKGFAQVGEQFGKQRDEAGFAAQMMLRFRRVHEYPALLPIHIGPLQGQDLRWTTNAPVAA
ncbi:MAG: hypothetical protein A2Y76_14020 [Planctomycetes bacterium RBG_13_60_9]|nr:MAG: hypothetical protein A2Y76_14020 [Planctomycetes bacterium RBG_13_60_9]